MNHKIKEKSNKTLNVSETNKKWVVSLKIHERESINDVMDRLRKMYKELKKDDYTVIV